MPEPNKILAKMLDRLLAGLVNGPSLNCRPYASRQRIDLVQLGKLADAEPGEIIRDLLEKDRSATVRARVAAPKSNGSEKSRRAMAQSIEAADDSDIPLADGPLNDIVPVSSVGSASADATNPAIPPLKQKQIPSAEADPTRAPRLGVSTTDADLHGEGYRRNSNNATTGDGPTPSQRAWIEQAAVLNKLHTIAEDARTYEQDTGVSVLNVGFPLLSLPPGAFGGGGSSPTRRVLAPIAFIPIAITVKRGAASAIELACKGEGVDRVIPNMALFAWLEQQTGQALIEADEDEAGAHPWEEICQIVAIVCRALELEPPAPFGKCEDSPGAKPGGSPASDVLEEHHAAATASDMADIDEDAVYEARQQESSPPGGAQSPSAANDKPLTPPALLDLELHPAPKADQHGDAPEILISAVLGLFPMANQGLLRDMQALQAGDKITGPLQSFIRLNPSLAASQASIAAAAGATAAEAPRNPSPITSDATEKERGEDASPQEEEKSPHPIPLPEYRARGPEGSRGTPVPPDRRVVKISDERFVCGSDPCQARAVRLARECQTLVVHGPPGTGKSQTITNIIGDHLARGQRVLVVCDKRTALDVVFNRLSHMGLGSLCAPVHDPRRDQRELYKTLRQQLDDLHEASTDARADAKLKSVDAELQTLHDELSAYRDSLQRKGDSNGLTFHDLVGHWLALTEPSTVSASAGIPSVGSASADAMPSASRSGQSKIPSAKADPTSDIPHTADASTLTPRAELAPGVSLPMLESNQTAVDDVLRRGEIANYGQNPWKLAAGISLRDFLAQPMDRIRMTIAGCEQAARAADATLDPNIPAFAVNVPLARQAQARTELAPKLARLLTQTDAAVRARWAKASADELSAASRTLAEADAFIRTFGSAPLDGELLENIAGQKLDGLPIAAQLVILANYLTLARKWYAFLPLRPKSDAAKLLIGYGLPLSAANAERLQTLLTGLRARVKLSGVIASLSNRASNQAGGFLKDPEIDKAISDHGAVIELLKSIDAHEALAGPEFPRAGGSAVGSASADATIPGPAFSHRGAASAEADPTNSRISRGNLRSAIRAALTDAGAGAALLDGLAKSAARAAALQSLEETLDRSRLFDPAWLTKQTADFRAGEAALDIISPLRQQVDSLEGVLRVRQGLAALPPELRSAITVMFDASMTAAEASEALRREALAAEISSRLAADPHLQEIDPHRLSDAFTRYRKLDESKRQLTVAMIKHTWIFRQKQRLLAATGARLNSLGADLRRRLMLRGERAMRLRQAVAVGSKIDGGDPLFDLCPVWLCSPETVAQVFPREPMFDVLVFDEASQMRLEESLPVLVRGRRVVISGDPRQLPPTRFFESAVAVSEEEDAQTDQDLFEQQQGEIEDLLSAALGLDIQQCYLDVHYRSQNADLIQFSNEHFYGSRLQPIPAHPRNVTRRPPVEIEHIGGVYERRRNEAEAERVVEIVKELLEQSEPPSIGIACFNLVQRDLVVEKLDELGAENATFARRLETARTRQGAGSFEGLFVKNLENVQGDERDYILISTTYGPDKSGAFYRRFGPLGRSGGGRRLNVLVTRARQKVHVLTSIPAEEYRSLPQPEAGQTPGGAWLLFAYLKFADDLQQAYAEHFHGNGAKIIAEGGSPGPKHEDPGLPPSAITDAKDDAPSKENSSATIKPPATVTILPARSPSTFAQSLARRLASEHGLASQVHWGNDGFCVDLALMNPDNPSDVTIGVLCDAARFAAADDPMQWDIFRTAILEGQGWKLHRLWTPHFYRDPSGVMRAVVNAAETEESKACESPNNH